MASHNRSLAFIVVCSGCCVSIVLRSHRHVQASHAIYVRIHGQHKGARTLHLLAVKLRSYNTCILMIVLHIVQVIDAEIVQPVLR